MKTFSTMKLIGFLLAVTYVSAVQNDKDQVQQPMVDERLVTENDEVPVEYYADQEDEEEKEESFSDQEEEERQQDFEDFDSQSELNTPTDNQSNLEFEKNDRVNDELEDPYSIVGKCQKKTRRCRVKCVRWFWGKCTKKIRKACKICHFIKTKYTCETGTCYGCKRPTQKQCPTPRG